MNNKIELLAPAGNEESFKAAVNAGADAVYMGLGKHNARVMAKNFNIDTYMDCIDYAHVRGVKVYLTLNTLVMDDEIKEALEMLSKLYERGLDAVIVQDIGLASIIHKVLPKLHMHASTQMSTYSLEQVKLLEKLGFTRVVLARELTSEEVKYITENTSLEIEAFIHGALCVCLSGQCLMSLAIGTRSANRGACAQPCRMRYTLCKDNNKLTDKMYLLSKKDIYGLDILDKIIDSNITSLKIEGRNKTPEYVALVVSKYRKYIDKYIASKKINIEENDEKKMLQMFNRNGKSHGYWDGVKYKNSITLTSPKNTGLYLGKVIGKKGKYIKIRLEEDIDLHDGIEIYSKKGVASTIVTCIKDEKMQIVNDYCQKGKVVYLGDVKENYVLENDKVYKTSKYRLNLELQNKYVQKNIKQRELVLNVVVKKQSPVTLSAAINNEMYTFNTNIVPEDAINKEITLDSIHEAFSKTQDTGIKFAKVVGYVQRGLFLRVSVLNEIRRNFVLKIEEKLKVRNSIDGFKERLENALDEKIETRKSQEKLPKRILSIYSYDNQKDYAKIYNQKYGKAFERIDIQINDYIKNAEDILHKYSKFNLGVVIPNFVLKNLDKYITGNLERLLQLGVKTIVLGNSRYIEFVLKLKQKYDFTLVADYSFNISNKYSANFFSSLGFDIITPSFDANDEQISKISELFDIELVDDYITVMTSRYCILGSFVANREEGKICSAPCKQGGYYLEDTFGEKYDIVCSNIDCVMKILKKYNLVKNKFEKNMLHIRNNII